MNLCLAEAIGETVIVMSRKASSKDWMIQSKREGWIPLTRELVFVGKSDCDIVLDSSSVDERHAVISFSPQEGLFYIKDLNTSHGTFVNDWKIPGQTYVKLEHLNKLRFGFSSDTFTICRSDATPLPPNPLPPNPLPSQQPHHQQPHHQQPHHQPGTVSIQPRVLHPQPLLSDPDSESPAVLRMKYAKKHHSSTIFPLPFCEDGYKPPSKPLVGRPEEVSPVPREGSKPLVGRPEEVSPVPREGRDIPEDPIPSCSNPNPATCSNQKPERLNQEPERLNQEPERPNQELERLNQEPERQTKTGVGTQEAERLTKTGVGTKSKRMPQEPIVPKEPPAPPTAFTISFDEGPKKFTPPKLSSMDRPKGEGKRESMDRPKGEGKRESMDRPRSEGKRESGVGRDSERGKERGKERSVESKVSPISESAAYLINRMLQSQKSGEESESDRVQSPTSESERGLDSGVCDDRSECGTYTLESERKDADVEKARKMIDDVFGVKGYVERNRISPDSSPECSTPSNSIVARNPSPAEKESREESREETGEKMKTFTRGKGSDGDERSSRRRGRCRDQMSMSGTEPSSNLPSQREFDSPSRSASSSRTVELKGPKVSPLVARKHLYARSKSNLSVASNDSEPTSFSSTNYKSDLKLDKSDLKLTKSDLKLNRAFALRRARLGIETPGVPLNLSCDKPPKVPADNRSNQLSRSDGGRFSLRAGRGSAASLCSGTSSRKSFEHRRPVRGKTCSDTERAYRSLHESVNKSLGSKSKQMVSENEHLSRGSIPGLRPAFGGRLQASTSSRQQANVAPIKRQENEMSVSMIETRHSDSRHSDPRHSDPRHSESIQPTRSPRVMSALDNLVLAAVMQLSSKLKRGMRDFLEKEERKYPRGSDTRMMIEEILPQVTADDTRLPDNSTESPSKELSNILKNLKKIEQSLEVLTLLADIQPVAETSRCFSLEV